MDGQIDTSELKLPMIADALAPAMKRRVLLIATGLLDVVQKTPAKEKSKEEFKIQSTQITQACLQLIVHLTRDEDMRATFVKMNGISIVLKCSFANTDTLVSLLHTIIQQSMEDSTCLQNSMEQTIKYSLLSGTQLISFNPNNSRDNAQRSMTFRHFVESVSPLVSRNQYIFFESCS